MVVRPLFERLLGGMPVTFPRRRGNFILVLRGNSHAFTGPTSQWPWAEGMGIVSVPPKSVRVSKLTSVQ